MELKRSIEQLSTQIQELNNELMRAYKKCSDLELKKQALEVENRYRIEINQKISELKEIKEGIKLFMLRILHGKVSISNLDALLAHKLERSHLIKLYNAVLNEPPYIRKKALAILYHLCGISQPVIIEFLFMGRNKHLGVRSCNITFHVYPQSS